MFLYTSIPNLNNPDKSFFLIIFLYYERFG